MEPIDPREREDDRDDEHERDTSFDRDRHEFPHSHHDNPVYEPNEENRPLIDPVERRFADKEKAEDFLRSVFVDPRVDQILCGVGFGLASLGKEPRNMFTNPLAGSSVKPIRKCQSLSRMRLDNRMMKP